jgi:hypothetical protein
VLLDSPGNGSSGSPVREKNDIALLPGEESLSNVLTAVAYTLANFVEHFAANLTPESPAVTKQAHNKDPSNFTG